MRDTEKGKRKDDRDKFTVVVSTRVRQAFDELSDLGFVPGRLVNELLEEAVPHFERLARAARAAKEGRQVTFEEFIGETLIDMGEAMKRPKRGRPRGSKNKPKQASE